MTQIKDSMAALMATTGSGHVVIVDGILDIQTVADTARNAMLCALYTSKKIVMQCADPDCDCVGDTFRKYMPDSCVVSCVVAIQ